MAFFGGLFAKAFFFRFLKPFPRDDAQEVSENGRTTLDPLANDFSFFGRGLKVTQIDGQDIAAGETVDLDGGGSVTLTKGGELVFDPGTDFDSLEAGQTPTIDFDYTVSNGIFSREAEFELTVIGENDAPQAPDIFARAEADETTLLKPLVGATDPEDQTLRIVAVEGKSFDSSGVVELEDGTRVILEGDTLIYDPRAVFEPLEAGQTAVDTFTYTISDGNGGLADAVIGLTIVGVDEDGAPEDFGVLNLV